MRLNNFYIQRHDCDGDHIYCYPTHYLKAGGCKGIQYQVSHGKAVKSSLRNAYPHFNPIGAQYVPEPIKKAILARVSGD